MTGGNSNERLLARPGAIRPASRFEAAASNREDLYRVKAIASGQRYDAAGQRKQTKHLSNR
jgi:hypothetical protein